MLEIVNVVASEFDSRQLEEFGPADSFDPLAHTLELCGRSLRTRSRYSRRHPPPRASAADCSGKYGMASLLNLGARPGVAYFPADPNRQAVVFGVAERHRRAYGVAVAAIHALFLDDLHRRLAVNRGRTNRTGRTGGYERRDFAHFGKNIVLDLREVCDGCPEWQYRNSARRRTY